MITLRDMLEQGIQLQGNVKVQTYHHDKDEIEILYVGEGENIFTSDEFSFIDMEVGYIFPDKFIDGTECVDGVCIELICEDRQ